MKMKFSTTTLRNNFLELRAGKTGRGKLIDKVHCDLSMPGDLDFANRKLWLIARQNGYYFSDYKTEEK